MEGEPGDVGVGPPALRSSPAGSEMPASVGVTCAAVMGIDFLLEPGWMLLRASFRRRRDRSDGHVLVLCASRSRLLQTVDRRRRPVAVGLEPAVLAAVTEITCALARASSANGMMTAARRASIVNLYVRALRANIGRRTRGPPLATRGDHVRRPRIGQSQALEECKHTCLDAYRTLAARGRANVCREWV